MRDAVSFHEIRYQQNGFRLHGGISDQPLDVSVQLFGEQNGALLITGRSGPKVVQKML